MGFTKLDEGIVRSSVWSEPTATRVVWITMLAMAGYDGRVLSSRLGLERIANVPHDDFERAIKTIESPDSDSRSPEFEGRRIEKIDGGWLILNYAKYRKYTYSSSREALKKRRQRRRKRGTRGDMSPNRGDISASSSELDKILSYLNEKTGKHFRVDSGGVISARLKEGATLEDFKQIIDTKVPKWRGRTWEDDRNPGRVCHGDDYLRPSTLFSRKHFDEYLNEQPVKKSRQVGEADPREEAERKRLAALYRADYDAMVDEHEKQFPDDKRFPPSFMEYAKEREVKK